MTHLGRAQAASQLLLQSSALLRLGSGPSIGTNLTRASSASTHGNALPPTTPSTVHLIFGPYEGTASSSQASADATHHDGLEPILTLMAPPGATHGSPACPPRRSLRTCGDDDNPEVRIPVRHQAASFFRSWPPLPVENQPASQCPSIRFPINRSQDYF